MPATHRLHTVGLVALLAALGFPPVTLVAQVGEPVVKVVKIDPTKVATHEFPDTTAGKHAAAFVAAFNKGDDAAIRAFEEAHRAASALKARSIDDRVRQLRELIDRWGNLDVIGIRSSGDLDIVVMATAERTGQQLELGFELEAASPHKVVGIRIATFDRPRQDEASREPLTTEERSNIITGIAQALDEKYVYPEKGKKLAQLLQSNLASGQYDDITHPALLANRLTADLQAACHDRHLTVRPDAVRPCDGQDEDDSWWARGAKTNHGFERAERLPGNIGYLKLNLFEAGEDAQKVAAAAMNFLARTDALIFDLRDNGGGSPEMIAYLSGYLFDKSVHLNSFYKRPTDNTTETWSRTDVPGDRYGDAKPVYVLTSHYTFSGAEEFTYNLKNLKRATIVGATTGGGAHPVMPVVVDDRFTVNVPFARAINPITKTNWEGTGVTPDVEVPATRALLVAQKLALTKLGAAYEEEQVLPELRAALAAVNRELPGD